MLADQQPEQAAVILLLCRAPAWRTAIEAELGATRPGGPRLTTARTAQEAMARLTVAPRQFSHLLLEPEAAGVLLDALLTLTSGEAGPGPALVLLGPGGVTPEAARRLAVTVPAPAAPGWLAAALAPRTAPKAPKPGGMTVEAELRHALATGQTRVLYQPVVTFEDRRPIGLEALARMEHPVWGRLPPEYFLPGLEAAGLVWELTSAVIELCFSEWNDDRLREMNLRLGINLPLDILLLPALPDWLDRQCHAAGVSPRRVVLELVETQPVTDVARLGHAAAALHARGYRLAIDDVGPGQRDPFGLLRLPFSILKLDKAVVREAADSAEARSFLRRTIDGAHAAGMSVVAEGVEDAEIWARMRDIGADSAQGYGVARPLPAAAVPLWHHAWCAAVPPRHGA